MRFFSSSGQDRFLLETFFKARRNGVFLEIGADPDETASNTVFFERSMGWRGLCTARDDETLRQLAATRRAACDIFVPTSQGSGLADLIATHGLAALDYCAIDAGAATAPVLAAFEAARIRPGVVTIRHAPDAASRMAERDWVGLGQLGPDLVFRRRDRPRLAQTSIICAVWSGDPKRADLLRGHIANLARQSVPVEPIYVFDGNDRIPPWVKGSAVTVREKLGLYQAWNLALSLAQTNFVMNLNLDDRLAEDAVEILERALSAHDAALVGGEWNITYSQKETDAVERCYPAEHLPAVADWEQRGSGTRTRLGSGTGEQGTYGPATLWRLDAHIGAPRYPWRFPEGTIIRSAADAAWWLVLARHQQKKLLRLPIVIGNYHYHPKEQAQYRSLPHDELQLIQELGVSLL